MKRNRLYILPLLIAALTLAFVQTTFAAATPAGTVITNDVTVSYDVGGLPKTATAVTPPNFTVDSKIDLNVLNTEAGPVSVLPATGAYETQDAMRFVITNTGNEDLWIDLSVVEEADGAYAPLGVTDNDANDSLYQIFVDSDGDRTTYNVTNDTATSVAALDYDDGVATYNTVVWVVPNFDDATVNNDTAVIHLLGTITGYNTAGTAPTTTGGPGEDVKDAVQYDIAGTAGAGTDDAGDAKHSDDGVFVATVGVMTTNKTFTTPAGGFFVPGERITYQLELINSWGVNATSVVITDDIDDQMAFVCSSELQTVGNADGFSIAFDDEDGDALYNNTCDAGAGNADISIEAFQITITGGINNGATKTFTFITEIE